MIQLSAKIDEGVQLSAQVDENDVKVEGQLLENDVQIQAEVKAGASLGAKLLPAVLLCACLAPTVELDAQLLPPAWTDGTPANFITADGYYIQTADGYLLCVQDS